MDRFATLEPVKLYAQSATTGLLGRGAKPANIQHLIGKLPADLHIAVLTYVEVPDVPAYSRTSHILAELARDERVWKGKWTALGLSEALEKALDDAEARVKSKPRSAQPPLDSTDDEFGEFTSSTNVSGTQGLFLPLPVASLSSHPAALPDSAKHTYRQKFIRVHSILRSLLPNLSNPPHLVLSSLYPEPAPPLITQAQILHLLALFLSPGVRPVRAHENLYASTRAAIDRFQAGILSAFDTADGRRDTPGMCAAAAASWEVWEGRLGGPGAARVRVTDWELARVWAEKREVFYEQGRWRPVDNFTYARASFSSACPAERER